MSSQTVEAIARYLTYTKYLKIVDYFLDFQDKREVPRKTKNPVMDFLVSKHEAQPKSVNVFRCIEESKGKNKPWSRADLM